MQPAKKITISSLLGLALIYVISLIYLLYVSVLVGQLQTFFQYYFGWGWFFGASIR